MKPLQGGYSLGKTPLLPGAPLLIQVKCMTPTELKAALQRTFDIRLSPPQLGAVAHLFGTGGDAAGDADVCAGGTIGETILNVHT